MKTVNSENWEERTERWVQMLDESKAKKKKKWEFRVDQKLKAEKRKAVERRQLKSFWR